MITINQELKHTGYCGKFKQYRPTKKVNISIDLDLGIKKDSVLCDKIVDALLSSKKKIGYKTNTK